MRARSPAVRAAALLLVYPVILVLSQEEGYLAEHAEEDPIDLLSLDDNTTCPTDRVLRSRETCGLDGVAVQCIRLHCCDTHLRIAGRCIPKSVDPCSLKLCEQKCEVQGDRLWCTCHSGFTFSEDHYRRRTQPYCVDVNECAIDNGGCEELCVNDPGGYHCACDANKQLARDGKRCERRAPVSLLKPLPLMHAASRCYAPCEAVTWLSEKVQHLTRQLHTTQAALKKLMKNPILQDDGASNFADNTYRVLDATAPLEGGYCRCERGPRGPQGPPGMEGPKGDEGARGPRGPRGPQGSLDMMLLLLADVRHDIKNLEARVYKEGEKPERFNLQKAWRRQRKQEKLDQESRSAQELEAYTAPPVQVTGGPVQITPHGQTGEIPHEDSNEGLDKSLVKGELDGPTTGGPPGPLGLPVDIDEKIRQFQLLANATRGEDDEEMDTDYDYSFY